MESLKWQTLAQSHWELIIVDNKSDIALENQTDISWHRDACIVNEDQLGLIHARIKGTMVAKNEIIVTVDDDTPLYKDYLENVLTIYKAYPNMGSIGGKTVARYETIPPAWVDEFKGMLAIRDLGDTPIIAEPSDDKTPSYPSCAPLLIAPKRSCMIKYIDYYHKNLQSRELGRKGNDLSSGEDNDINLFIFKSGYSLGYFPQLKFIHIIPKNRYTPKYLANMAYKSNISWIKVLNMHKINPHQKISKWTILPRQLKAWFKLKAWRTDSDYIKWKGACGVLKAYQKFKDE